MWIPRWGFIPLDGLIKNTRSGSIDSGILIHLLKNFHLLKNCHYTGDQLDQVFNRQSGVSADMQQVFAASAQGNSRARLAVERLCAPPPHARWFDGRKPGGLDAWCSPLESGKTLPRSARRCAPAGVFLGLTLEPDKNANTPGDIEVASDGSAIRVLVAHTQEDWQIALEYFWLAEYRL